MALGVVYFILAVTIGEITGGNCIPYYKILDDFFSGCAPCVFPEFRDSIANRI